MKGFTFVFFPLFIFSAMDLHPRAASHADSRLSLMFQGSLQPVSIGVGPSKRQRCTSMRKRITHLVIWSTTWFT